MASSSSSAAGSSAGTDSFFLSPSMIMNFGFVLVLMLAVFGIPDIVRQPLISLGLMEPRSTATARHILVKEESQAAALKEKIGGNLQNFIEAARQHSTCPSGKQGGSLGSFDKGRMVPAFDAVIFDPTKALDQVHGPVPTGFGFHLIWIEARSLPDEPKAEGKKAE
ncbi:unnamed protein product [Amoebophrya sp. A25]|nr:unnamed protein product [Amoebophrya sp. A25]|eukprot:GSA25T00013508001.1